MLAGGGFSHTVTDGPLLVAAAVAALVGVIGFISPCVLPLVPGYLSYVAGMAGDAENPSQRRMVAGAVLFVLGFTLVLVAQGAVFGALGGDIRSNRVVIERVLGGVTVLLGIVFLGGFGFMQREFKFHRLPKAGLVGAPLLGLGFGVAWTPCLTPTFTAVNTLSFTEGSAGRGSFLMACYCLGLGIPFVLMALGFGWVSSAVGFIRRHRRAVSAVGGGLLIAIGVLLLFGVWDHIVADLQGQFSTVGFEV